MNVRPAEIGDRGVVLGLERHGSISGLLIQIAADEQAHLYGDARMISAIVEALEGEHVEVVETENSSSGAHGVCPVEHTRC